MNVFLFENFAAARLANSINDTDTEVILEAGQGGMFPDPEVGVESFLAVLVKRENDEFVYEVVECTERSGDAITITRGFDDTSPTSFSVGDLFELRLVKANLERFSLFDPIGTNMIADEAVTNDKLADNSVDTRTLGFDVAFDSVGAGSLDLWRHPAGNEATSTSFSGTAVWGSLVSVGVRVFAQGTITAHMVLNGNSPRGRIVRWRGGSTTIINSFSGAGTYQTNVAIQPGDVIIFQLRANDSPPGDNASWSDLRLSGNDYIVTNSQLGV